MRDPLAATFHAPRANVTILERATEHTAAYSLTTQTFDAMNTVLFLCTGNYYRSRFAEFYFRHLANQYDLNWQAESRGLQITPGNVGPLSVFTQQECERRGICAEPLRMPLPAEESDFGSASLTIAVKELEHRPLMRLKFPDWENRVEYWQVHDLDCAMPDEALPMLAQHVEDLIKRLAGEDDTL